MAGAVGAFGAGKRVTVWILPGTYVAGRAGQRAGDSSRASHGGAATRVLAVEPSRAGITLCLAR